MILAVGLSPAWQKTLVFSGFLVGEVNRATEVHSWAAGKPVNVGVAVHHLGGSARILVPLGGNTGDEIERALLELGVECRKIPVLSPTRVCTTVIDQQRSITTELVENAGPLSASELEAFALAYRRCLDRVHCVVLSGSLPEGVPKTFYRELAERATSPVVVDARGEELLSALAARPLVVKPNRRELEQTLGYGLDNPAAMREAMRTLAERGARWVVVSHGPKALWAWGDGQLLRLEPPAVPVVNAIGSGDCLAAGIACAVERGMTLPDAIRFGMAAAADNVTRLMPARTKPAEVEALREAVMLEKHSPADTETPPQPSSDAPGHLGGPCVLMDAQEGR
jgi:tagatose 6-phosphate kinase